MYDQKCGDLARAFLNAHDYPALSDAERDDHAAKLAQDIQNAIESYLAYLDATDAPDDVHAP